MKRPKPDPGMSEKQLKARQLLENEAVGANDLPCASPDTGSDSSVDGGRFGVVVAVW